jgi:hypothetical protein
VQKDKWLNDWKGMNMNKVQKILSVLILVVAVVLPTKAQMFRSSSPDIAFRSTSTMVGSGSAYCSSPMLTENGTATYSGESSSSSAPSGPKKIVTPPNSGTQQPIGDALLPMMLMALLYVLFRRPFARHF